MKITQKIKKLIIILSFMIIFTLSCLFYKTLNPFVINMFLDKFKIVSNDDNLLVHFIDVDQADAAAINLPDGKVMLIDTGSVEVNTTYVNYLKENVLHTKSKDYIDYLVLSHADMDHVGGTLKLFKNFKIGTVYIPQIPSESNGYAEILNYVDANCECKILGEDFLIFGKDYEVRFFEILNRTNTNDSSQIVKLEYKNKSFLFCGDISASVEEEYINQFNSELDCDVLKVSHHGSKTATSLKFLETVTPDFAIISVGAENNYGHPSSSVINRLNSVGANVVRTDEKSNVLFILGDNYDLQYLNGRFYITRFSLNYVVFVMVLDVCLILLCVAVILKKEKNKHLK